jgi:hypothetical protein
VVGGRAPRLDLIKVKCTGPVTLGDLPMHGMTLIGLSHAANHGIHGIP